MSADLFAEFNNLSNNPAPPSAQPQSQPRPPPQAAPSKEPFDFFNSSSHASTVTSRPTQGTPSWSAFQSQPSGTSSWSNFSAPSAPAASSQAQVVVEEDDDGWGDFEVAHPATTTQGPVQTLAPSISSPIAWQSPSQPAVSFSNVQPSINWQNPAQTTPPAPSISSSIAWQGTSAAPALNQIISQEEPVKNRIVRASTMDLMSNNLVDFTPSPQQPTGSSWGQQPREPLTQQLKAQEPHQSVLPASHESTSRLRVKPKLKAEPSDPSVLFDAEDFELQVAEGDEEEDDDEFGDFETVPPAPPSKLVTSNSPPMKTSPLPPSMDLLSLNDPAPSAPLTSKGKTTPSQLLGPLALGSTTNNYPQAPKSPSFQDRNPFPDLAIKTPTGPAPQDNKLRSASPVTAWPTLDSTVEAKHEAYMDDDDEWGAWDDFPTKDNIKIEKKPEKKTEKKLEKKSEKKSEKKPEKKSGKKLDIDSTEPSESWDWDAVDNVTPSRPEISDDAPPPINVPPPSVILSVFPELLETGDALFKPISGQTASIKQRILSDPKAFDFVEGYILLATTAARVIAGRKQRWHRDKILAKSMSISAAGSKGMKLAGIDKTQSAREDREAADVVAVWRGQVGRLRSAVAAAKAIGKGPTLQVPEISESMQIQTAKMVPTAPKPCVICGLKRDERISKVDYNIEDSFGEWWAEHWGHKACKNFWIKHERMLRQR